MVSQRKNVSFLSDKKEVHTNRQIQGVALPEKECVRQVVTNSNDGVFVDCQHSILCPNHRPKDYNGYGEVDGWLGECARGGIDDYSFFSYLWQ